ncbi:EAL and GGDEF domain-containing protein [Gilvimarinus xylanilyticus]|uniref:cyclic-guanylate-specific phosphodiesterase n=1 Tax=Gilvimarinus xylanilyticus TaxID=2944139 RepID=A0A9X2I1N5_9GAMM|nr:EAL domain-containing protein [Gilvimarinus xylanilyticus]MCP8898700.1 EAL domain-containing protein [Gilvimarinus xylanilyticus]
MHFTADTSMEQLLLRTLAANSLDLIYAKDRNGHFLFANVALAKLFGLNSPQDMLGKSDFDLYPDHLARGYHQDDQQVIDSGEPIADREEQMIDIASGEHRWYSTTKIPLKDVNGAIIGLVGITRDITASRNTKVQTQALNRELKGREALRNKELEQLSATLEKERQLMRTLIDALPDNIYAKDLNSQFLLANHSVADSMGTTSTEILGKDDFDFYPAELAQQYRDDEQKVLTTGKALLEREEPAVDQTTGRTRWLLTSKIPFRNKSGRIVGLVGIGRDISRRRLAELALRRSEERFRSLTELSSDWYWEQDERSTFTDLTDPNGKSGFNRKDILGRSITQLPYCEPLSGCWIELEHTQSEREPFRGFELRCEKPGQKPRFISLSGMPVFDDKQNFCGYRGIGQDITARRESEDRVHFLATHDSLTELPNRFMFHEILDVALKSAQRHNRALAVLFIDLDRFKNINDTLGHDAGDQLLQVIGQRFTQTLRASDVVARLGGDEFVVLLQDIHTEQDARIAAQKLIAAAVNPVIIRDQECRVTASVGICMYPADADDGESLMKNADIAMYLAKEEGKNTYQFYSPNLQARSRERLELENHLRLAVEQDQLFLHYQAKRDLKTGAVAGVEALVRWQHPSLGVVPPNDFIPLAEETGLIVLIGRWVLKTACLQSAHWQQQGLLPVCMSVNLSPRQFYDEYLIEDIRLALQESGLAPANLELEITESMVMQNTDRAIDILRSLKALGVRLAIDDFGVGYSLLAQIKQFPVDTLKVDSSFIRDIPANFEDKAITQAIIAMGKTLSLTVIAEGVETLEQESFLREHNCDQSQGYFFSRPIAAEGLEALLRDNSTAK